jgi:putative ABC transport system permease protein
VEAASANRIVVQSAVSLFVNLPQAYQSRIATVDGIEQVAKWQWFGGVYRDPGNFFPQFAVDADKLFAVHPELDIVNGSADDFVRERDACVIGSDLAERFGFAVGDTIPLVGTIFPRTDGGAWDFRVAAIYHATASTADNGSMFFHYAYLSEALESGAATGPRGVGVYVVKVAPGAKTERIMRQVDALYENGPQRVQTTTEAEFNRQFVTMIGSVPTFLGSIGAGVLFAILLASVNTMLMAARERTREFGILKAIGYPDRAISGLLLVESLTLCGSGGLLGVVLAKLAEPGLRKFLVRFFPGFAIGPETMALGLGLALLVGLLAGILPAWRARRLVAVDALRAV